MGWTETKFQDSLTESVGPGKTDTDRQTSRQSHTHTHTPRKSEQCRNEDRGGLFRMGWTETKFQDSLTESVGPGKTDTDRQTVTHTHTHTEKE